MDTVAPKKKGRPATGRDPLVTVRLTPGMLERIARWREGYPELTASETLRILIDLGLNTPEKKRFYVHDPKVIEQGIRRAETGKDKSTVHSLKRLAPPVEPPRLVEAAPFKPK
jgi:hypothetical protein